MNSDLKNDLFYFCSMVEYIGRKTHNKVSYIISKMSDDDINHELKNACVNHSLSFD